MSWTYFTTNLDGTRPITKAERDELYDAFMERVTAAGLTGTYSVPSAYKTSGILTDLVTASGSPARLLNAMADLGTSYVRILGPSALATTVAYAYSDWYYDSSGTKGVLKAAASILGYSDAEVTAMLANPTIDMWKRWNLIRQAIRCCFVLPVAMGALGSYEKIIGHTGTWPDARDAFIAVGEAASIPGFYIETTMYAYYSATDPFGAPGPYYVIDGNRLVVPLTLPGPGSSSLLYGWRTAAINAPNAIVDLQIDALSPTSLAVVDTSTNSVLEQLVIAGLAPGSRTLHMKLDAYDNAGQLDWFEPTVSGDFSGRTTYAFMITLPDWVYPN